MKKMLIVVACLVLIFCSCASLNGKSDKINTGTMPNSLIVQVFSHQGINPEIFAERLSTIIQFEIFTQKISKNDTLEVLNDIIRTLNLIPVKYIDIAELLKQYEGKILESAGKDISNAVVLAYILVQPDLPELKVDVPVSQEDIVLLKMFVSYLINNVNVMTVK